MKLVKSVLSASILAAAAQSAVAVEITHMRVFKCTTSFE